MAAVFITAPIIVQSDPTKDMLLCDEVSTVLYEAVADGVIPKSTADEVSRDCYSYFLFNNQTAV